MYACVCVCVCYLVSGEIVAIIIDNYTEEDCSTSLPSEVNILLTSVVYSQRYHRHACFTFQSFALSCTHTNTNTKTHLGNESQARIKRMGGS